MGEYLQAAVFRPAGERTPKHIMFLGQRQDTGDIGVRPKSTIFSFSVWPWCDHFQMASLFPLCYYSSWSREHITIGLEGSAILHRTRGLLFLESGFSLGLLESSKQVFSSGPGKQSCQWDMRLWDNSVLWTALVACGKPHTQSMQWCCCMCKRCMESKEYPKGLHKSKAFCASWRKPRKFKAENQRRFPQ